MDMDPELLKLRFDYAWKWFSFHADQRTKMFNFMLIVVGIFATAIVGAVKEGMPRAAFWLCVLSSLLAIVFVLLDRRNRDLVWLGEDVLRELERRDLFGEDANIPNLQDEAKPFGILWRQARDERSWWKRNFFIRYGRDAVLGKHRVWLRLIAALIAAFFLGGALIIHSKQDEIAKRDPSRSLSSPGYGHIGNERRYGAIIDAGSSGSRLAIFEWRIAADGVPHVWPVVSVEDDDGPRNCPLTSLPENQAVCDCLLKLAERARKNAIHFLGEQSLPPIQLWAKATAGVRTQTLEGHRAKILSAANACLANPPGYEWKGAEVISGEMEGVYAWLAVNHVAGTLRSADVQNTHGIVELGGQSAQLAYRVSIPVPPPAHGSIVEVPMAFGALHIYTFSHDSLGSGAAGKTIKKEAGDACTLHADRKTCVKKLDTFIRKELCPQQAGKNCLQLRAPPGMLYSGLSGFKYVIENIGLGAEASLKVLRERADTICGPSNKQLRYTQLVRNYALLPVGKHREGVCFNAFYATQLVNFGWGISLENVSPPNAQWAGNPSWPLGAMIFEVAKDTPARRSNPK